MKPFHQAARYVAARFAVDAMRTEQRHTILEVGAGSHGNLAEYLPEDAITFLDTKLSEEALQDGRFVQGDATRLSYPDGSFDFVIGLDVLEHIAPEQRGAFLDNACRVAKRGIFLTFPHASVRNETDDEVLRSFYQLAGSEVPEWINEHIDCTLPDAEEVRAELECRIGPGTVCPLYAVDRALMQKMLVVEAAASGYSNFVPYYRTVNDVYSRALVYHDIGGDRDSAVKSYMLCSKCVPIDQVEKRFMGSFEEKQTLIHAFEADIRENLAQCYQLETLRGQEMLDAFAHQAFEVLNGRVQAGVGEICDRLTEQDRLAKQYFEVLDGRGQAEFGEICDRLTEQDRLAQQHFEVLDGRGQARFGQLSEEVAAVARSLHLLSGEAKSRGEACDESVRLIVSRLAAMTRKLERLVSDEPVLDVILITYNQSGFIEETLHGLLAQKTNFPFRVLVADDCSKDDTAEKIRRMAESRDIPFVFLPGEQNLGVMRNYRRAFAACTAEFVAILEGDDIWTDPFRLQSHVDFLRSHSECAMSFNRYVVKNFEEGTFHVQPRFSAEEEQRHYRYITGHDLAYDNLIGNFSTSVYRSSCLKALPEQLFEMRAYDWLTNILVSKMGFIGCLMKPTSIYRIHSKGVWSGQNRRDQLVGLIATIDAYNQYTNYEFSGGFMAHRERLVLELTAIERAEAPEEPAELETDEPVSRGSSFKQGIKRCLRKLYGIKKFMPPIFLQVVKLLVPPVIQDRLYRIGNAPENG